MTRAPGLAHPSSLHENTPDARAPPPLGRQEHEGQEKTHAQKEEGREDRLDLDGRRLQLVAVVGLHVELQPPLPQQPRREDFEDAGHGARGGGKEEGRSEMRIKGIKGDNRKRGRKNKRKSEGEMERERE